MEMVQATVEHMLKVSITLNKREALLIKQLVQNPLCEDETHEQAYARASIFNALPDFDQLI